MAKNNNLGDFLKSLADKFRSKINTTAKINPQDFEGKVDEVYTKGFDEGGSAGYSEGWLSGMNEGKQAEYDTFWDNYQSNGNRTIYEYAFCREGWNNETFKPKYNITVDMHNSVNMFSYSMITGSLKTILNGNGVSLTFHNSGNTNGPRYMFVGTKFTELPELDFSEAKGNAALASTFSGSTLLQTIEKIILPDSCTDYGTNTFYACRALETVNFQGRIKYSLSFAECPLSGQSVYNIFQHLDEGSYTGTRTLSFNSVAKNNFIDVVGEDEWNHIVNYFSLKNWTFSVI